MNSLSWMLYLAEMSGNIGFVCGAFCVIGGVAAAITWFMSKLSDYDSDREKASIAFKVLFRAWIFFCVIGTLVPGKETIFAIAASEYGEEALKSPEASKARQALNAWLDKQIAAQKPEK